MKKSFILVGMLAIGFANAQTEEELQGRVGINTKTPKASLDISRHTNLPETRAQGVLFPKFSTAERSLFTNIEEGTMIYNTDKKCLEMYMGVVSGVHQWDCLPNSSSSQQQNLTVTPVGFEGSYIAGVNLTTSNKAKFKIVNNSFAAINNIDFSSAVTIQNGTANITATGVNANNVSLASGAERILEYTLSGSPENGTLTANFSRLGLTASQNTTVGMGSASFSSADNTSYVVSLIYNTTVVQGKINNTTNKLTIKIPYTNGQGSYNAFTNTQTTAAGQGNDINPLTLTIPQGNFGVTGELTATITVGGDGEYLVKQMAPGQEYVIATFPVNMNGATTNVVLKGIGGIPDRKFNEQTDGEYKHRFIYIPIEVTGANGYRKTWLNNNLGAEYADANNPRGNFNPVQQAKTFDDHLAYGSSFQWQRPSDGHELMTWTNGTTSVDKPFSTTLSNNPDWTAGHSKFISDGLDDGWSVWVTRSVNSNSSRRGLWEANGANNPCPTGFHVPTDKEMEELANSVKAFEFDQVLRLPHTGYSGNAGTWNQPSKQKVVGIDSGERGLYWTSSESGGTDVQYANSYNIGIAFYSNVRALRLSRSFKFIGQAVRCISD